MRHLIPDGRTPERVVILGAKGFVARAIAAELGLQGVPVLALGREALDLTAADAGTRLAPHLKATDAVVFASANAPCKTPDGMVANIAMARAVCTAIARQPVAHLVYISSDAVYADTEALVRETTPTAPNSLHGLMHLAREGMLRTLATTPLAILRPSLLYGAADPHNGYGPNAFRRLAAAGKPITLFGAGEEQRDHVLIDDVARLAALVLRHRSTGTLDVATGRSLSFHEVATLTAASAPAPVEIVATPRKNPIKHRHFDPAARIKTFPDFVFTPFEQGLTHG